jgi:hypothetical protein
MPAIPPLIASRPGTAKIADIVAISGTRRQRPWHCLGVSDERIPEIKR